jgi:type IV pilus assembly protein PilE
MIVVAIVGILAAIAYPSYQAQVTKSKRAEGKAKLLEVAQSLEKCKALFGAYDAKLCNAFSSLTTGTKKVSSEGGFYLVSGTVGATTFTLLADPQQDDARCGNLTLDQAGGRDCSGAATDCDATHTPPSDTECW